MDYLEFIPVLDNSGLGLDVFLDGRKVGRIDKYNKEIEVDVKIAEEENSNVNRIDSIDSYWEYSQSTGQLTHVDKQTGERTRAGTGQSGNGVGLYNPDMQNKPFVGPIPQGTYDIGRATTTKGPLTLPLTPRQGTDTFVRDLFRIHGDNSCGCQSASKGCIILPRNIRERINNSGVRKLKVVR